MHCRSTVAILQGIACTTAVHEVFAFAPSRCSHGNRSAISGAYNPGVNTQPPLPGTVEEIRAAATARGRQLGLPYAGALLPREAYALMQAGVRLVDVRTRAELYWVGQVPGSLFVEWSSYPSGQVNANFLEELAAVASRNDPVMFLCRSGNRSHYAAMLATQAGWRECYNVLEGFEGDRDASEHRASINGWKVAGLPWAQS